MNDYYTFDNFERLIRDYKSKHNLTNKTLAEKIGCVGEDAVKHWAQGRSLPTNTTLQAVLNTVGYELRIDGKPLTTSEALDFIVKRIHCKCINEQTFLSMTGYSPNYLSVVKKTRRPSAAALQTFCDQLGLRLSIARICPWN